MMPAACQGEVAIGWLAEPQALRRLPLRMTETHFTVESVFNVYGLGLALVGLTAEQYGSARKGDLAVIQQPDGTTIRATVRGVEYRPSLKWTSDRPATPRYAIIIDAPEVLRGSVVTIERAAE